MEKNTTENIQPNNLTEFYYDVPQAAKEIDVTRQTIYRWINAGKLPIVRVGKEILIGKETLYGLEDARLVDLIRKNIVRKLRHVAEQYHWFDEVLDIEFKGHEGNAYTFILRLNTNKLRKVVICMGGIKVNMSEAAPTIEVEIKSLMYDGKKANEEDFPRWV